MPRSKSRFAWLRYTIGIGILLGLGLVLAWPAIEIAWTAGIEDDFAARQRRLDELEAARSTILALFLSTWFFFFGATVGSFLNVVIWRMPRNETVVTRPSRCPWCSTKIKASDNIPVLGWIMLGGKCRTCRLPISPRYPIVEATMGAIFLLLLQFEVLSGGGNLPGVAPAQLDYARALFELRFDLLGLYAFHCFLFCILLCWSLIAWDRQRMPHTLGILAYGIGFFAPLIWPHLYPVRWSDWQFEQFADAERVSVFLTALCGAVAGAAWGWFLRYCLPASEREDASRWFGIPLMLTAVGLFLGWEAPFVVAALALGLAIVLWPIWKARGRSDLAGGVELSLLTAAFVYVLTWDFWDAWLGLGKTPQSWLLGLVPLLLALLVGKLTWRAPIDLERFRRPDWDAGKTSPELQLVAPSPSTADNKE